MFLRKIMICDRPVNSYFMPVQVGIREPLDFPPVPLQFKAWR